MNGHPKYLNPAFTRVFGWELEELENRRIPFVPESEKQITAEKIKEIFQHGRTLSFETKRYTKNHAVLDLILSAAVCKDRAGNSFGMVVNIKDISEKKALEAQFEQAQKMESLGTLAGGIAHDFNNYLSGLFGYIDLARNHAQSPRVLDYLNRAIRSADRAKGLARQLLTFSKGGAPIKKVRALSPFLEETTEFALSGGTASCDFDLPENLWTCNYDKTQIGQVIDNIVINAQHAMPSGGNIHVAAQNIEIGKKEKTTLKAGQYVRISISDTGTGISPKNMKRIFDPFFSTKQAGSGLGLTTAYSIVKRHGGIIDVKSETGTGSVFHILLPATGETILKSETTVRQAYCSSGKILVMDDEDGIREMLEEMLEQMGFSCVLTPEGQTALDTFKTAQAGGDPFRAVILDLTIPGGMGGKRVVRQIRELDRDIPVFIASGYSEDKAIAEPAAFGFTASVEKPFTIDHLAAMFKKHL